MIANYKEGKIEKQKTQVNTTTYLSDHFTTFARAYLGEQLENQTFCYFP